jgi:outer membrane protein assembly factor BamB
MWVPHLARLTWTLAFLACSRASDPTASVTPPPSREQPPAVAPAKPAPISLPIAAPSPSTRSQPSTGRFGVRWRVHLPGLDPGTDDTQTALVIGNDVFVSEPVLAGTHDQIAVYDLATGARRRTVKLTHTQLVAAHGALVATNGDEEFGLDLATLRPTWHARASLRYTVGDYLLETPPPPPLEPALLRLRRASDGQILWENAERLFSGWGTSPRLDGDTLYVQAYVGAYSDRVAAIDVATGAVRWRADGYLRSASAGHVVIQDERDAVRILDASGAVRWRADAFVVVRGDRAYATTTDALTAIELSSNRVLWRRSNVSAIEADDTWLYGMSPAGALEIIDGTTGELAGEMQLGFSPGELVLHGPAIRVGAWLFGLGPEPAPEQPALARGCLIVTGCPGSTYGPVVAKVTIDGTTTRTDRRGCFRARTSLGLGPAHVEVASATAEPLHLDTPFPTAVVFDRATVTLQASWLGTGCHDTADLR